MEEAVQVEMERNPSYQYPPQSRKNGPPVIYSKSQPIPQLWEVGEIDTRSIVVKIVDFGNGKSFLQFL